MEYTTERGITIDVTPIPMFLDELQRNYPDPPEPTYTETQAGGATREIALTEADMALAQVENPEWYEQYRGIWESYQKTANERSAKVNDAVWRAICLRAIRLDLPADNEWVEDQESLGMTVPTIPRDRKVHYIRTEVVGGPRDMIRITALAAGVNIDEEAMAGVEASFRGLVQGAFAPEPPRS